MRRGMISVVMIGSLLVLASWALAQEKKPSGTLKLSEGSVAIGIGFSWGSGVLTYEGKEYPFSVEGLSVADVGISRADATGVVYNLTQLTDFNGNYTAVTAGAAVGGGAGATTMRNQNGVVIDLIGTTQGVKFNLSVDGVRFTLKQ
jgi:hypothetical protein